MFFSLQQSAFLHALGSTIGNSLWQLAALWLVFVAISSLTKMNSANRYSLAVLFSTAGFVWFICSLVIKYVNLYASPLAAWDLSQSIDNPIVANGFSNRFSFIYDSILASLASLAPYVSCAYLLVWLLLATRLVNGFRQVKQFGTQGLGKVHIDLKLFVQKHATLLQIQKKVRIFTSDYVQSPLTIGFFKPLILLPIASMSHLSPEQVEAILLHELAHIKRHDYLVNIFVQVAEITLFFNPFMRLLLKQIKQERENCCDDYVLQFQYNAADYAKALLSIAQNRTATLFALGAKSNQFLLLNRIKRMVAPQPQTFNYRQQLCMLCLVTIIGLGVTVVVPNSPAQLKKAIVATRIAIQPKIEQNIDATENKTEEISNPSPAPKSYDFIKSIQHLASNILSKNIDLDEIEKMSAEIESHNKENEEQAQQIAEKALKEAQLKIVNANLLTKKLGERFARPENQNFLKDGNIDAFVSSVLADVDITMKELSFSTTAAPQPAAKAEAPVAPAPNVKLKLMRQVLPERKASLTKEQIEYQQANTRKSMDSLQSAMAELGNVSRQNALNKIKEKLIALKNKENWDVALNESESINKAANRFTAIYTNKMDKIIKKWAIGLTADVNIKGLNTLELQLKSGINSIQYDRINIRINDKHQEKNHHKNADENPIVIADGSDQGS